MRLRLEGVRGLIPNPVDEFDDFRPLRVSFRVNQKVRMHGNSEVGVEHRQQLPIGDVLGCDLLTFQGNS